MARSSASPRCTSASRLNHPTPDGWIPDLVVTASARRRGAARALLTEAERVCRERGCWSLTLESAFHRTEAHVSTRVMGWNARASTSASCSANWYNQFMPSAATRTSSPRRSTTSSRAHPRRRARTRRGAPVRAPAERGLRRQSPRRARGGQAAPAGAARPGLAWRRHARARLARDRRTRHSPPSSRSPARRPPRARPLGARDARCIGVDAARRCAERAPDSFAPRSPATSPPAQTRGAGDGGAPTNAYEDLLAHVVDGAENLAYRLALNTLVAAGGADRALRDRSLARGARHRRADALARRSPPATPAPPRPPRATS